MPASPAVISLRREKLLMDARFVAAPRLVIMARIRFVNPALQTIAMWIARNTTTSTDTKK